MLIPRYGERSLADVLPSVMHALGVHEFPNTLQFEPSEHIVLLVVDGMGWEQVAEHIDELPTLGPAIQEQQPVDAAFPTTTPVGLASLTLGAGPGTHGFVGATFMLPDFDQVLAPLHWDAEPHPLAVQPITASGNGSCVGVAIRRLVASVQLLDSLGPVSVGGAAASPPHKCHTNSVR